mmetsp:Transcript_17540/g.26571  ORF Transcript_17540/g.26571 Transcript_17540/m.26571 type:complete len:237 (+) Transcript_17540:132-842(+)
MGNAAAKQVESAVVVDSSTLLKDDSLSIASSLISKEKMSAKLKGTKMNTWVDASTGNILYTSKSKGLIKSHAIILDAEEKEIAIVVTAKKGMKSSTLYIGKKTPSFKGQKAASDEDLKKAGIEEGTELYAFAVIDAKRGLSTGKGTYSLVTGEGKDESDFELKDVYTAEKLSSMGYQALFKEAESESIIAKAATKGVAMTPTIEFAAGVDMVALILLGQTLAGDGSAGALAGAGVV